MTLDGLDGVNWHELRHAYGRADDVPRLLRDLAVGPDAVRQSALDDLFASINHQGDVYEASVAAVPFLARIARDKSVGRRWRLWALILLAGIAGGTTRISDDPVVSAARRAAGAEIAGLLPIAKERGVDVAVAWIAGNCEAQGAAALSRLVELERSEQDEIRKLTFAIAGALVENGRATTAQLDRAARVNEDFADGRLREEPHDSKLALEELASDALNPSLI